MQTEAAPLQAVSPRPRMELLSVLTNRRFWRGPFVWVVLVLLLVNQAASRWTAAWRAEAFAQASGQGQAAPDPATANRPVRYDWSISDRYEQFVAYVPDSRQTNLVILSGMSQMYTINDFRPGDQTISEWMDDVLAPKGTRVFGLAAPNLSHEESVFILMSMLEKPQTKPDAFIFAVAFEKLREVDLRPQYLAYLRKHPELVEEWRGVALKYRTKYPLASAKMLATLESLQRTDAVANEATLESRLRTKVAEFVPIVRERKTLNAKLRVLLFTVRNAVLGIKNTTKRPIIPDRYNTNREFLGLLAEIGREHGVNVMFFIVPFNPHAENPYIPEEYASFKTWLSEFAEENGTPLANLENVVPTSDWGLFLGGPDFKHFRGEGHRKTAAALVDVFSRQLVPQSSTGAPQS